MPYAKTLQWFISIILSCFILLIPNTELFTIPLKIYFAITILGICMFAFELLPTLAISLFLPFSYLVFQLAPLPQVFNGWTQTTVWQIFAGMLLGTILTQCNLVKRAAFCLFKHFATSYSKVLLCIMVFGVFMAYLTPGGGILFIILGISLCEALNIKPFSHAAVLMLFTVYVAGNALNVMLAYDGMFDAAMNIVNSIIAQNTTSQTPLSAFRYNITYLDYAFHNIIFLPSAFIMLWSAIKLMPLKKSISTNSTEIISSKNMNVLAKYPVQRKTPAYFCSSWSFCFSPRNIQIFLLRYVL